jgi:hypothetical protein
MSTKAVAKYPDGFITTATSYRDGSCSEDGYPDDFDFSRSHSGYQRNGRS